MKKLYLLPLITAVIIFFLFSTPVNNTFAQTYTCEWVTSCIDRTLCPSECTYPIPCTSITSRPFCHDTQADPLPCSCSQQLNLQRLYNAIQSQGGSFSFSTTSVGGIVSALLVLIFPLAGLIFLLILIVSGFKMMTSGGDPKKAASAKEGLTAGIVGFIIIFTAYWLVQIIARVLGLTDIRGLF